MTSFGRNKICLACLFGGKSFEHEISIQSAARVIRSLDRDRYEVLPIWIDKKGQWFEVDWDGVEDFDSEKVMTSLAFEDLKRRGVDVAFPILHGPNGEDGTIAALLSLVGVPYIGMSPAAAALSMNKDCLKKICRACDIATPRYITVRAEEPYSVIEIAQKLAFPCFVKISNGGSSIGVYRCRGEEELSEAIEDAFAYDTKLIVEEAIEGMELEMSLLGGPDPFVSWPGEVIPKDGFYSYEAKYEDPEGAEFEVPADLSEEVVEEMQRMAKAVYRAIDGEGLARVDFFLTAEGRVLFNEINPMPGFTSISLFPRMLEESGIDFEELMERLVQGALDRYDQNNRMLLV